MNDQQPESITNTLDMTFNKIPAGTFIMGSPETEEGRDDNERQHEVTITKAFYMQTTAATQGQWKAAMGTEPWTRAVLWLKTGGQDNRNVKYGADYPATWVSWDDAAAFCIELSEKEGKTYRLPTEAEWEYACRAGTETRWCFGDDEASLGDYAWYDKNSDDLSDRGAHEVALKKPSAFGLYEMHGNVFEWCHDCYEHYYKQSPEKDPTGAATGPDRVLRGGSWNGPKRESRSAVRHWVEQEDRYVGLGFRVVRELD